MYLKINDVCTFIERGGIISSPYRHKKKGDVSILCVCAFRGFDTVHWHPLVSISRPPCALKGDDESTSCFSYFLPVSQQQRVARPIIGGADKFLFFPPHPAYNMTACTPEKSVK
jgi:hypothetical protein